MYVCVGSPYVYIIPYFKINCIYMWGNSKVLAISVDGDRAPNS